MENDKNNNHMADEKSTIIFRMGEETGIVIEKTTEQFEHSLFREQYKQAFALIDDIIARTTKSNPQDEIDENVSNVIAFCGDRGEGKTSALVSVRGVLQEKEIFEAAKDAHLLDGIKKLDGQSFKVLKLIDPAFFDDNHNLIELLLGQMYADIQTDDASKSAKPNDCPFEGVSGDIVKRNALMQLFQEVRQSLGILNKPSDKNAYDNLEEVDELAAGIELKEKLRKLMCGYANYFHKERVLICIDDLDLNVTEGYKMCEEIRKYLSSPDVCFVMMAIKVEQLVEVVQSYLRDNINVIVPDSTITEMAIRYVTKLLPETNRINMPKGLVIVDLSLVIKDDKHQEPYDSVKEAIVQLIYRKTRYIFVNGRNVSPIVPANLRSLRYLLNLLWELPDAKKKDNADNIENKRIFKNYFYNTWIRLLDEDDAQFALKIVNNPDLTTLNKSVVMHLRSLALPTQIQAEHLLLIRILDPQNQVQNISVGDVFYVIKFMESINTDVKKSYFLFFLKAFYSIELYEIYDRISASLESLFITPSSCLLAKTKDKTIQNINEGEKPSIYKYDSQLQQLNQLQRMLNGAYFTFDRNSLIPSESGGKDRDIRLIDGKKLRSAFDKVKDKGISGEDRLVYLHLCEFFALTTIRSAKNDDPLILDRTQSGRTYYDSYASNNNYFVFDVLSIFYNVVNIQFAYRRWDKIFKEDFFAYAYRNENSLLKQTLKHCTRKYENPDSTLPSDIHHFISDAIIRFSELMLSVIDNGENQRNVNSEGGNANNLSTFYENIRKLGITLYPLDPDDENDKGYKLEFLFLKKIISLLNEIAVVERKLKKEERGEKVEITDYERFIESAFSDIYTKASKSEPKQESNTPLSLDVIFANSLAKKGTRYPKTKNQVLNKLKLDDPALYNVNPEIWLQIIDNKEYQSWAELRDELNQNYDEIVKHYPRVK